MRKMTQVGPILSKFAAFRKRAGEKGAFQDALPGRKKHWTKPRRWQLKPATRSEWFLSIKMGASSMDQQNGDELPAIRAD